MPLSSINLDANLSKLYGALLHLSYPEKDFNSDYKSFLISAIEVCNVCQLVLLSYSVSFYLNLSYSILCPTLSSSVVFNLFLFFVFSSIQINIFFTYIFIRFPFLYVRIVLCL